MKWFPKDRNLVPIELHIGIGTSVKAFGKMQSKGEKSYTFKPVNFANVADSEGPIKILGYLKNEFVLTTADRITYICNAITDGSNKINLIVRNTAGQSEFSKYPRGAYVEVKGFIDADGNVKGFFFT